MPAGLPARYRHMLHSGVLHYEAAMLVPRAICHASIFVLDACYLAQLFSAYRYLFSRRVNTLSDW